MSADLELQKGLRARLTTWAALGVRPNRIIDTHVALADLFPAGPLPVNYGSTDVSRAPEQPAIILGDSQAVDAGTSLRRAHTRIYHSLHVWKKEISLEGVKTIAGELRRAVHAGRLVLAAPYHCADARVSSMRFLRDPNGEFAHGVVVVEALVCEVLS
ncbi:DUF3168 domain-containing protein [Paracoccus sp. TOH]|uniref:DUF3168 domain-containing protein n=1 Tax=Paracoccus sp. TOH TaxID=1263728 RepID=UPI0025B095D4|nr:DUF3168 domain-containing protein [Paracoccus sp. TOH]WJS83543.1 DUF3168 domain-containing protein [Paracoccus sp. TOH]